MYYFFSYIGNKYVETLLAGLSNSTVLPTNHNKSRTKLSPQSNI